VKKLYAASLFLAIAAVVVTGYSPVQNSERLLMGCKRK
jgi:hypothetical protein